MLDLAKPKFQVSGAEIKTNVKSFLSHLTVEIHMQSYIRVYSWAKKVTLAAHTQCLPNKPSPYLFLTPFFSFYKSLLKVYAGVLISFFFPQRAIHARRGVLVPPPPWQILETQKHSHTTSPALSPASRFFWGGFKKETENLSQLVSESSSSIHHNNHYSRRVKSL